MIDVKCLDCQTAGAVNRVTAGLRCGCGSHRIALHQPGSEDFLSFMSAAHGPGTGWGHGMPDPLSGWSQYAGPMPGANTMHAPAPTHSGCPNCRGTGMERGGRCRACKGSGHYTPTTAESPEPLVKRHNYPSTQTRTPFMGKRKQAAGPVTEDENRWQEKPLPGREFKSPEDVIRHSTPGWAVGEGVTTDERLPNISPHLKTRNDAQSAEKFSDDSLRSRRSEGYPMHDADCPSCGTSPTHLVNDYKDDAWWHCPNCGPLENIDRKPHIDPYNPPKNFKANPRSFKAGSRKAGPRGAVISMLSTIQRTNPGLDTREALGIVRHTVSTYGE